MIGAQARASQRADGDSAPRRGGRLLVITVAAAAIALACYLTELSIHPLNAMLTWFDLGVYRQAGLIALHHPGELYQWHLAQGIRFTYTPFAAVLFAAVSWLPLAVLGWLMTAASLVALAVTGWLMAGALGWAGRARLIMTCAASAAGLWMEPVQRALHLGQIELLLMVAVVADRCMSDRRWWKGAAIGVAAGIKLVPLIFIPYLLLAGKVRQAVVASAAFAASIGAGFVFLPGQSAHFWLTGYFLRVQNVAGYGALVNQSVLGMLVRAHAGDLAAAPAGLAAGRGGAGGGGPGGGGGAAPVGPAGARLAAVRADRAAGVADQLGPPLGLDRAHPAGGRRRGAAPPRRRPLGLLGGSRRRRAGLLRLAALDRAARARPARLLPRPGHAPAAFSTTLMAFSCSRSTSSC